MRLSSSTGYVLSTCVALAMLSGCNGSTTGGLSPRVGGDLTHSLPAQTKVRNAVRQIAIPQNSCCVIAVDEAIDQIYVSSPVNLSGNNTTVVDGKTFSIIDSVSGFGGAYSVDSKTDNVWLPGLYSGEVEVYSGVTHSAVATVSLGYCPIGSWVDSKRRYAWVAAQCGSNSDPVWAINADNYAIVAGPIHTGGVMSPTIPVNPVTGRMYGSNSKRTFEVNPHNFALSPTSFGVVYNVNKNTNLLYAVITDGLNIVSGSSEAIKKTVTLSYTPSFVGVNPAVNHIYIGSGEQNFIEVREGSIGTLLGTIKVKGAEIQSVGANQRSSKAVIYAAGLSGSAYHLYEIVDKY